MILTYKYRIKDATTAAHLRRYAWACNQVWNYCVQIQKETQARWAAGRPARWLSYFDLCTMTREGAAAELGILDETLVAVLRTFAQARNSKRKCPGFRASGGSKRRLGWVPFPGRAIKIDSDYIVYKKRRFRFWKSRGIEGKIKTGAFVEDARGRWFVTLQCEVVDDLPTGTKQVGIDLGLSTLATLSDGRKITHYRHVRKHAHALATAQRANKRKRAKAIQAKIANCRKHDLHKATTDLVRENGFIVVGNVNAKSLSKTKMAKSVLDASWSTFRDMLRYKARRHGAMFLQVDEKWTSQTCSCCGSIPGSSPKGMSALGIRRWICSDCGTSHDRDVNAAVNILRVGLELQAPAEGIPRLTAEGRS